MGKMFWVGSVLGLAIAVGLWGYGYFVVGEETAGQKKKVNGQKTNLKNWAAREKEIKNARFLAQLDERSNMLDEESRAIKALMASRELTIDESSFEPAPPRDLAGFREWMIAKYRERDAALKDAGVLIPGSPREKGDVQEWEDVTVPDRDRVLREFVVSSEICSILASAKAKAVYNVEQKDGTTKREEEDRKVDAWKGLEYPSADAPTAVGPKDKPAAKPPYEEKKVLLKIHAHYNVVLDVLQKIESTPKCLFVIRKLSIRRIEAYPGEFPEDQQSIYEDVPGHEVPVEAEVTIGLITRFPVAHEAKAQPE